MNSTLEQLAQYVGQQLGRGIPEQNIRASLAQNRWTPEWIDAVFNVVHQNPNLYQTTSQQPIAREPVEQTQTQTTRPDFIVAQTAAQPVQQQQPVANEKKNTPRTKNIWLAVAVTVVLLGLAFGAYRFFNSKDKSTGTSTTSVDQIIRDGQEQTKTPDDERKDDLNTLLSDLADFYVANNFYPTYNLLKTPEFAAQNPTFDTKAFADPQWSADNTACTIDGKAIMAVNPTSKCYAYSTTAQNGAVCDNTKVFCTRMTVTAVLDDGKPYAIILERNTESEN